MIPVHFIKIPFKICVVLESHVILLEINLAMNQMVQFSYLFYLLLYHRTKCVQDEIFVLLYVKNKTGFLALAVKCTESPTKIIIEFD